MGQCRALTATDPPASGTGGALPVRWALVRPLCASLVATFRERVILIQRSTRRATKRVREITDLFLDLIAIRQVDELVSQRVRLGLVYTYHDGTR